MRISILPRTLTGKWCLAFAIAAVLAFIAWQIGLALEPRPSLGPPPVDFNWSLVFYVSVLALMAALLTGLFSIIKSGERSVLVFLTTLLGLFVLLYGLAIVLFAHGA